MSYAKNRAYAKLPDFSAHLLWRKTVILCDVCVDLITAKHHLNRNRLFGPVAPVFDFLFTPLAAAQAEQAVQRVFLEGPPIGLRQRDPQRAFEQQALQIVLLSKLFFAAFPPGMEVFERIPQWFLRGR